MALQQLRAWNVHEAALERVCSRVKAHHVRLWVGLFHVVMESNLYSGGRGQPFGHGHRSPQTSELEVMVESCTPPALPSTHPCVHPFSKT